MTPASCCCSSARRRSGCGRCTGPTAVCSHPRRAESMETAIHRRLYEELGLRCPLQFLFKFQYQAQFETAGAEQELCSVFIGRCAGAGAGRSAGECRPGVGSVPSALQAELAGPAAGRFTPWFIMEWERIWRDHRAELFRSAIGVMSLGVPLIQAYRVGRYIAGRKAARCQALSAGADAGAAVPVQPGLRRAAARSTIRRRFCRSG